MSRRQRAADLGISESTLRRREAGAKPRGESISAMARKAGLKPVTVYKRLQKWTLAEALCRKPAVGVEVCERVDVVCELEAAQLRAGECKLKNGRKVKQ
jgi:hypothetical protein